VDIKSIAHKGLKRLIEDDVASGVPGAALTKIAAIISFLEAAPDVDAVKKLQMWKAHQLTGDRKGTWSLTVTRNWRITFDINEKNEIENLSFEDYH
jgi:proteic killer suppression protein